MHPTLLRIGPITLRTYGFFVALGVFLAYKFVLYQAKIKNINTEFISNFSFLILLFGFIGARIFYVLLNFDFYKENIFSIFKVWEGGLVFYGGIIFGFLAGLIFIYIKKKNLFELLDLFAPPIFLGLGFGRIGCFFAGCCYGIKTDSIFGVVFNDPESLAPTGIKILPTQLIESVFAFLVFFLLFFLSKQNKFKNMVFFIGILFYSIFRFFIEFIRWDDRGTKIFDLWPSQFISVITFLLSFIFILYIIYARKKTNRSPTGL